MTKQELVQKALAHMTPENTCTETYTQDKNRYPVGSSFTNSRIVKWCAMGHLYFALFSDEKPPENHLLASEVAVDFWNRYGATIPALNDVGYQVVREKLENLYKEN